MVDLMGAWAADGHELGTVPSEQVRAQWPERMHQASESATAPLWADTADLEPSTHSEAAEAAPFTQRDGLHRVPAVGPAQDQLAPCDAHGSGCGPQVAAVAGARARAAARPTAPPDVSRLPQRPGSRGAPEHGRVATRGTPHSTHSSRSMSLDQQAGSMGQRPQSRGWQGPQVEELERGDVGSRAHALERLPSRGAPGGDQAAAEGGEVAATAAAEAALVHVEESLRAEGAGGAGSTQRLDAPTARFERMQSSSIARLASLGLSGTTTPGTVTYGYTACALMREKSDRLDYNICSRSATCMH